MARLLQQEPLLLRDLQEIKIMQDANRRLDWLTVTLAALATLPNLPNCPPQVSAHAVHAEQSPSQVNELYL